LSATLSANVESLTLLGTAAIDGTGNDSNNTIIGNSANNALIGGIGIDRLFGQAGDDSLSGGADTDILYGGAGADTIDGGSGNDYASYYTAGATGDTLTVKLLDASEVAANVANSTDTTGDAAGDQLINIEYLQGSLFANNRLTGDSNSNILSSFNGNDDLSGRAGNDYLSGGTGDDSLSGDAGSDNLSGGTGNDRFVFAGGAIGLTSNVVTLLGTDTITDFTVGTDKIVLSHTTFSTLGGDNGPMYSSDFISVATDALAAINITGAKIIYSTGSGSLFYDNNGAAGNLASLGYQGGRFAILSTKPGLQATDILLQDVSFS
jgi:glycerophosphoryl diester phosphodiesterase